MTRPSLAAALVLLATASCAPAPRMCALQTDCGSQASCVAGRCVARGATAAIDNARRLLFEPLDVGWVQRGDGGRTPAVATLGRSGEPGIAFLRFGVPLTPETKVVEAYILLERASDVDADPAPVALHAARVDTPWDSRSLSWARQPHVQEIGAPVTLVTPAAGPLVRVDVRDLVQRWRQRARDELGVAVVAEGESATGVAFALGPTDVESVRVDPLLLSQSPAQAQPLSPFEPRATSTPTDLRRQIPGPRLEVYVR